METFQCFFFHLLLLWKRRGENMQNVFVFVGRWLLLLRRWLQQKHVSVYSRSGSVKVELTRKKKSKSGFSKNPPKSCSKGGCVLLYDARNMHLLHVRDISIRVNAHRPSLSTLMQKILSDKTNADGGLRRSVTRTSEARCGARKWDLIREIKAKRGWFLTWVQTAVLSLQRQSLTGSTQLLLAVPQEAGGGRCGAEAVCAEMQPVCTHQSEVHLLETSRV